MVVTALGAGITGTLVPAADSASTVPLVCCFADCPWYGLRNRGTTISGTDHGCGWATVVIRSVDARRNEEQDL